MANVKKVMVGKNEYALIKHGRAQAEQLIQVGRWVNAYGFPAISSMASEDGSFNFSSGTELISKIIDVLDVDALLSLFTVVIGCKPEETEEHFDIGVLIDSVIYVYNENPVVSRALKRFFSVESSENNTETA